VQSACVPTDHKQCMKHRSLFFLNSKQETGLSALMLHNITCPHYPLYFF